MKIPGHNLSEMQMWPHTTGVCFDFQLQKLEISTCSMGHLARKGFQLAFLIHCVIWDWHSFQTNVAYISKTTRKNIEVCMLEWRCKNRVV